MSNRRRVFDLGQPAAACPALRLTIPGGAGYAQRLFTHWTHADGSLADWPSWDYLLTIQRGSAARRLELTPGAGLLVGERPDALRLQLTAAEVESLNDGYEHPLQLRITGAREEPWFYFDEEDSYIKVENRYE
jgi:hypothetical protein